MGDDRANGGVIVKFTFGIDVERSEYSAIVCEVEADSLETAKAKAYAHLRDRKALAKAVRSINYRNWDSDDEARVVGDSAEDYSRTAPDLVLP